MEDTERDTSGESTAKDTIESNRDAFEAVADYLSVLRPDGGYDSTTCVELKCDKWTTGIEYYAEFESPPAYFDELGGGNLDTELDIKGRVGGIPFHIVAPKCFRVVPVADEDPIEITFSPTTDSYERFGAMEYREGGWQELATTGIASPSCVWHAKNEPDYDIDADQIERDRLENYWTPTSGRHASPRPKIRDLMCILPEDISPTKIAEITAKHMEVDQGVVQDAVPSIRDDLRSGKIPGPTVPRRKDGFWRYTPDWAEPYSEDQGDGYDG